MSDHTTGTTVRVDQRVRVVRCISGDRDGHEGNTGTVQEIDGEVLVYLDDGQECWATAVEVEAQQTATERVRR